MGGVGLGSGGYFDPLNGMAIGKRAFPKFPKFLLLNRPALGFLPSIFPLHLATRLEGL